VKVTGWKVRKIGRVEGGKVGRSEGGKVGRSKPKPHGSLCLPQFLPYTFLTKISGGDLWSPPTNKIYTPEYYLMRMSNTPKINRPCSRD